MSQPTFSPASIPADTIVRTVELGVTITDAAIDGETTVVWCELRATSPDRCPGCGAVGIYRDRVERRLTDLRPRRRSWFKVRTRTTADAVVGGVIGPLNAPEALLLGLPDETGRLRVAGRTGPLTLPARRELGALLVPPRRTHPWPDQIPSSRFGQLPGDLVDYTPTEPLLVVEVDTDVCFDHYGGDTRRGSVGFAEISTRPI